MKENLLTVSSLVLLCSTAIAAGGGEIQYHACVPEIPGLHFGVEVETSGSGGVNRRVVNILYFPYIPYYVSEEDTCFPSSDKKSNEVQKEESNDLCDSLRSKSIEICRTTVVSTSECHAKTMEILTGSLKEKLNIHCTY